MHLSRLTLEPDAARHDAFWQRLGDAYAFHREVWRLFSEDPDQDRDFLYRLDLHRGRPTLFTLSPVRPEDPDRLWRIDSKRFAPQLAVGDRLEFRLRANPTVKKNGKRCDVVMDAKYQLKEAAVPRKKWPTQAALVAEHAPAWLERRAESLGVVFPAVTADGYQVHHFAKPGRNGNRSGRRITLATCELQGILEITEPDRFVEHVTRGVGPAKGFGCGLMLLRRAR